MSAQYPTPISIAGSFEEPEIKRRKAEADRQNSNHRSSTSDDHSLWRLLTDSQKYKGTVSHNSRNSRDHGLPPTFTIPEIRSIERDLLVWGYMICEAQPSLSFLLSKESRCGKKKSHVGPNPEEKTSAEGIILKDYNGDNIASSGYLLGKHYECDVVIDRPDISERHCVIFKINSNMSKDNAAVVQQFIFLQDISGNGTYVNGRKVLQNEVQRMQNHDRISLTQDGPVWTYRSTHCNSHFSFEERFAVGRTIGRGHFAEVHEVKDRSSGQKYAAKIIKKKMITEDKTFLQEIGLLMACTHPLITCIRDVFETDDEMYLILELAAGGELFDRIIQKGRFSEDETRELFSQLFSALQYLHSHHIVHRDIKPENILLASSSNLEIRLADFGLAKIINDKSATTTLAGTPSYIPPEMLSNPSEGRSLTYSYKVDSWSAGVVLYICLCGFPPFSQELAPPPMKAQIRQGLYQFQRPYWDSVSDEAIDLVRRLLTVDPDRRISVADALQHPFMLLQRSEVKESPLQARELQHLRKGPKRQRTLISDLGRKKLLE